MRPICSSLVLLGLISCVYGFLKLGKPSKPKPTVPLFCSKPPFNSNCHPLKAHWYYDSKEKLCKPIAAGLCSGGFNRFTSRKKCLEMCQPRSKILNKECLKLPTTVPCGTEHYAWYFDASAKSCKMFTYSTCNSTGNFFLTELKCQGVCLPKMKPKPFCSADPISETCFLRRKHVYFNFRNNLCTEFPKKGCGKGTNSFSSFEKCIETCSYNQSAMECPNCEQKTQGVLPPKGKPAVSQPVGPVSPLLPQTQQIPLIPPSSSGKPSLNGPVFNTTLPSPPMTPGTPKPTPPTNQASLPGRPMQPGNVSPTGQVITPALPTPSSLPALPSQMGVGMTLHPNVTVPAKGSGQPGQPSLPVGPVISSTGAASSSPSQAVKPSSPRFQQPGTPALPVLPGAATEAMGSNKPSPPGVSTPIKPILPTPTNAISQPKRAAYPLRQGFHTSG
uniref:Pancreatic trypsin inhibitor n=1 Tax=Rhipicephalus zambeziensis TaxID=60191 RepID=A0A224Y2L0_9ACAR